MTCIFLFLFQVELVGMSYIGLKAVVDFLYSGELLLDGGNIESVLEAAHLLQVTNGTLPVKHIMYIAGELGCITFNYSMYEKQVSAQL